VLEEYESTSEFGANFYWNWWVLDGVTTSSTDICNTSADIEVSNADTVSGQSMSFPDVDIGPFTSHGISGCMYYGAATKGATVGTMTCPGVDSIFCERDPQFNTQFVCGPGVFITANVLCIF
jgi:hypothetical protein